MDFSKFAPSRHSLVSFEQSSPRIFSKVSGVSSFTSAESVGNHRVRKLPAYEQFLVLAFAQLTWRESLRDIETCLASFGPKLYHAGIRQPTARNTLAVAKEQRDWRIFADFAHVLIQQATALYADEPFRFEFQAAA